MTGQAGDSTETDSGERFHYQLAGLLVRSSLPLPAPAAPAGRPDIDVVEGDVPPAAVVSRPEARPQVSGDEDDLGLRWPGIATMRVHAGRSITVSRDAGVEGDAVAPFVLGAGMGLILHQRGRLVLHASAVALPEGAVAFVGMKGAGKSTAAGALLRRGHPVVTDDALPLDLAGVGSAAAWPGPAPLKLWPESATALGRPPRRLPRLHPAASKRVVADVPKTEGPVPLLAIYSLDVGEAVAIEPLTGSAALLEVMRHSYAPRFLHSAGATPEHFDRCSRLVKAVPLFRLLRPAGLEILDDIAASVEAHGSSLAGPGS